MRVALTSERPLHGVTGGWAEGLVRGLPEHQYSFVAASDAGLGGRPPRGSARRSALEAYEALLHALVEQDFVGRGSVKQSEDERFAGALRGLARHARGGGLPRLLRSAAAERVVESVWRTSGADAATGEPTVRDALCAVALLEPCLRPLSGPWDGDAALSGADLCHVVGGGLAVLPALLARWAFGTPLMVTEFGPELRDRLAAIAASPYRRPVRALLAAFLRRLARESYRQAGIVTAGSEYVRRWQEHAGADGARVQVVPGGLPLAEHRPVGPEPTHPTLLCPVEVGPGPALDALLAAFAQVRETVPGAELVRSPGGAGDPAAATVLVLPEFDRPRGGALAAAALSGRAVVATDVGVARELLGPAGLLVPPGDPAALATACTALLRDEERRSRLGLAGRLRLRSLYDAESGVDAFRGLYLDLVAHSGAYPSPVPRSGRPRLFARPVEFWLGAASAPAHALTGGDAS